MELWDIENQIIPANYRISSDASVDDVKQEIDTSILIGKAHAGLTTSYLGLFLYYDPKDAVPLVGLYLGYSALVYCASSFDNFQTCKTLRHPEENRPGKIYFSSTNSSIFLWFK